MLAKKLKQIETRIRNIKRQLQKIGEMRPGSLTRQYKKPKERKGAYYQLSYTQKMKSRTEYVRRDLVGEIRQQIVVYKRFRKLVEKWLELAIEHSRLKISQTIKTKRKDDKTNRSKN